MTITVRMGYETRKKNAIGAWDKTWINFDTANNNPDLYETARKELFGRGLEVRFPLATPEIIAITEV